MKSSELRGLSLQELDERLEATQKNLYQLRTKATLKELEKTSDIRLERRNIARIKQAIADKKRGEVPAQKA